MASEYKPYLNIFVVWHPGLDSKDSAGRSLSGRDLAERLYRDLCRNPGQPVSPSLGIPVYFRTSAEEGVAPERLTLATAMHTVVILLADPSMTVDEAWRPFLSDLLDQRKADKGHLILPVVLAGIGGDLLRELQAVAVQADKGKESVPEPGDERDVRMRLGITAAICRLLLAANGDTNGQKGTDEVPRLFISHAKRDGEPAALQIKALIETKPLDTFFDKADIPPGYDWSEDIKRNVVRSAIIFWQTDEYASRPWCNIELLTAKEHHRPILGVVGLKAGEERSFPYAGNVRTIVSTGQNGMEIIAAAVREYLRKLYTEGHFKVLERHALIPQGAYHLFRPPEPVDGAIITKASGGTAKEVNVFYPDPPVGTAEAQTMSSLFPNLHFSTPTLLGRSSLRGLMIGLSISPPDLPERSGGSLLPLRDAMVEIAKHLLVGGAAIAYGGGLRAGEEGHTRQLFELVRAYYDAGKEALERIHNFLAFHMTGDLTKEEEEQLQRVARFHKVPAPSQLVDVFGLKKGAQLRDDVKEDRYIGARCLTLMRQEMNSAIDARVVLGGKYNGMYGIYPGIFEEAYLALSTNKPLFLIGGFGGCTRLIVQALRDKAQPQELTEEFQIQNARPIPGQKSNSFLELQELYKKHEAEKFGVPPPDYPGLIKAFNNASISDLSNGLDDQENRELFETVDISRIVLLLMKGMSALKAVARS